MAGLFDVLIECLVVLNGCLIGGVVDGLVAPLLDPMVAWFGRLAVRLAV